MIAERPRIGTLVRYHKPAAADWPEISFVGKVVGHGVNGCCEADTLRVSRGDVDTFVCWVDNPFLSLEPQTQKRAAA